MIYPFKCDKCGSYAEVTTSVAKRPKTRKCANCGSQMRRIFSNSVDATMIENPRYSKSLGCMPDQIPEMMRKFPGSEYHPKTGDLLIKSRAHKLQVLKQRGCIEQA